MKYEPNAEGDFAGQSGYGYKSIATFIEAAVAIREDYNASPSDFHTQLATVQTTTYVTAILEAGRRSLDANGSVVTLEYDETGKIKSFPNP
jgi:D-galacturonate reductase